RRARRPRGRGVRAVVPCAVGASRHRGRRRRAVRARRARVERVASHASLVAHTNRDALPGELAMARSTAEIQAEIAVTRRLIEQRLEVLRRRVPDRWWVSYAVIAGALVVGAVLSRVPMLKLIGTGARAVEAGLTVASTGPAADRLMADPPPPRTPACGRDT